MATIEELERAGIRAHKAGDFDAAQFFADEIKRLQTLQPERQPPLQGSIPLDLSTLGVMLPGGGTAANVVERITGRGEGDLPVPPAIEAGAIGAGRTGTRLARGVEDLAIRATGGDPTPLAMEEAEESALYAPLQREHPVATLVGETFPYMGAGAAGPAGLLGSAAFGGGLSALEHQPTMADRGKAGLLGMAGGAVGYGLGRTASRLLGGRGSLLDDSAEAMAKRGEELGFRLTPAQRSGSRVAGQVEAAAEATPITSRPFSNIKSANQVNLNKIAARALGIGDDVERITADRLGQAVDDIGRQFDDAVGDATIALDDQFIDALAAAEDTYRSTWGKGDKFLKVVDDALTEAEGGSISGARYKQLQTMLREEAKSAIKGQRQDSALGNALFAVKDALDDAAARSLGGERFAQFRDAQSKWKVLKQLQKSNVLDPSTGNVSALKLANVLNAEDVSGFRHGKVGSDLYDAARFGRMFHQQIGDSGTATRQSITQLAQAMGLTGGGGAALGMASENVDPETAATLGLLMPLLARGGAGAYTSRFAQRGILPMSIPSQQGLAGGVGGILAGSTGRGSR